MAYPEGIQSFSPGLVGFVTYPGKSCTTMIFYAEGVGSPSGEDATLSELWVDVIGSRTQGGGCAASLG
jgi:hypothetical protein